MSHLIPCSRCMDQWDLMGSVPKGEILSCAIFICSCYYYLTFVQLQNISHYFHSPFSIFRSPTLSYDPLNPLSFYLLSSIFHSYFDSSFTYFHISCSILCSFVLFLLLSFYHLSIIPCLPFPTLTTYHSIPCDSVSHFFTFSVLHCSLYYSKSCSIKFLLILYLLPSL